MSRSPIHLPGRSLVYKYNVGAMEGQDVPEGGRPASPRPAGLARARIEVKQLTPTPGEDQKGPGEGSGQMVASPGRLA
jgi:hypothetical protein